MITSRVRKYPNDNLHIYGKIAAKVCVFLLFIFALFQITAKFKTYFPIKSVKVYGLQHVDQRDMQSTLTPLVKKGFFAIDVETIKDRLLQSPWVSQAVVQRKWPDQVLITVTEKKPLARWNNTSLISTNGEIFTPAMSSYPSDLPVLSGAEGDQILILQNYKKLSQLLAPLHFKITRLVLTPEQSWSLSFDNGMKVSVGYKDVLTHMSHFVKVYPKIIGNRVADVDYVDLRYPNGLAVKWKAIT